MKIFLILFILSGSLIRAQTTEGEKALQKVLDVLTLSAPEISENPVEDIQKGAWEALSYMEELKDSTYTADDLLEAVPDYYHFEEKQVFIKLINPENYNEYGVEAKVPYLMNNENIELYNTKGEKKDSWKILYLDSYYLALDMGDVRVFFTHTPPQE